jgi:hypothetical protein
MRSAKVAELRSSDEEIPYVAIGNNELGGAIGDVVRCPHCRSIHKVEYGDEVKPDGTKVPSKLLGFYNCGAKSYLCAIGGKSVMERFA